MMVVVVMVMSLWWWWWCTTVTVAGAVQAAQGAGALYRGGSCLHRGMLHRGQSSLTSHLCAAPVHHSLTASYRLLQNTKTQSLSRAGLHHPFIANHISKHRTCQWKRQCKKVAQACKKLLMEKSKTLCWTCHSWNTGILLLLWISQTEMYRMQYNTHIEMYETHWFYLTHLGINAFGTQNTILQWFHRFIGL